MSQIETSVDVPPDQVWEVLADGWLFPLWVVGATRMRAVDEDWPRPGAQLHHSVGTWPLVVNDTTEVLECRPPHQLRLRARAWPGGSAEVLLELEPTAHGTRVRISEDAVSGPGRLVPGPVRQPMLRWRNNEALRRLRLLCEGRER